MILAIDIGNTHTVVGVFDGEALKSHWRLSTSSARTADETWVQLRFLCQSAGISTGALEGSVIASVVPSETDVYIQMIHKYLHHKPISVSCDLPLGIRIKYDHPQAVGADRLCNAVAAFERFGGPVIVVDFGTATTYDVIATNGDYLGGVIAPGVATASAELHRRAAKLPNIDLTFPSAVIGRSTIESMQSGILYGAIDAMEGMIHRIAKDLGRHPVVVATGGFSAVLAQKTKMIDHVVPTLVLDGARLIHERTLKYKRRSGRARR